MKDQIDLVAFTLDEVGEAGLSVDHCEGDTDCATANRLHVDVYGSDHAAYATLCQAVFSRQRPAFRITKSEAKRMAEELDAFGCQAFPNNDLCPCVDP